MYFDAVLEIPTIAARSGCSIFVVPKEVPVEIRRALVLQPEERTTITIEQVRNMTRTLAVKQLAEQFVIVRPADKMGIDAANAFLKNLEEPGEHIHYVLVTDSPSMILPTIMSRAAVYILRQPSLIDAEFKADEKVKGLAKRLIAAKATDLPALADEITKKKEGVRAYALEVLEAAVEMTYKSYFITGKTAFITKIPKLIAAHEAISQNGHAKLHLVADLL
ncbi:hypothetical protein IJJ37_03485 [Candidatus Saccharibacteria bacterium]|nr:hypothetical protein [Candidatus Saccharibacteria bacterium]